MKIVDLVAVIISFIALIGSLIAMYVLVQVGIALNAFTGAASGLGSEVVSGVSQFMGIMQTIMLFGWVWSVAVLVTSLYAIWVGIKRLRAKTK